MAAESYTAFSYIYIYIREEIDDISSWPGEELKMGIGFLSYYLRFRNTTNRWGGQLKLGKGV